jgi:hypothetical protein
VLAAHRPLAAIIATSADRDFCETGQIHDQPPQFRPPLIDIAEELRKARERFDILLRKAKSTLMALNIELNEEDAERTTPIMLSADSLSQALSALGATGEMAPDCADIG